MQRPLPQCPFSVRSIQYASAAVTFAGDLQSSCLKHKQQLDNHQHHTQCTERTEVLRNTRQQRPPSASLQSVPHSSPSSKLAIKPPPSDSQEVTQKQAKLTKLCLLLKNPASFSPLRGLSSVQVSVRTRSIRPGVCTALVPLLCLLFD